MEQNPGGKKSLGRPGMKCIDIIKIVELLGVGIRTKKKMLWKKRDGGLGAR